MMRYEADVLPGLEEFAEAELSAVREVSLRPSEAGKAPFVFAGEASRLLGLRSVVRLFRVVSFAVPRPKALLGDQHWRRILAEANQVREFHPKDAFRTVRLAMAGDDSPVAERIKRDLASALGLEIDGDRTDDADLLIRLRRGPESWEALFSLTPRPLSTRSWRVADMPGALNATLAHAMARLAEPKPTDRFFNVCCGSGTLLIERAALRGALSLDGGDTNPEALACAGKNVEMAKFSERIGLHDADATDLPYPEGFFDAVVGDLPFGQKIGSHKENVALYPKLLAEAARVLRPGGKLVLLTHEHRLFEKAFDALGDKLEPVRSIKVSVGGMNPKIYVANKPLPSLACEAVRRAAALECGFAAERGVGGESC